MLIWRLTLGTLIIAALAGLCVLDFHSQTPGLWLFPLAFVAALLATGEIVRLLSRSEPRPLAWTCYLGNLLVVGACAIPLFWPTPGAAAPAQLGWVLVALGLATGIVLIGEMTRYTEPGTVSFALGKALFAIVYVGVLLSCVVQLRTVAAGPMGLMALVSLIAVVKMGDIGAYTVGRLFGRHKMAPVLSPGKTWEGAGGGLLFGAIASYAVLQTAPAALGLTGPKPHWLLFAILVTIAGMLGDLAESLLKRDAGVKDSSEWMPGFGGVLDILDSILLAAPVAYALWAW